MQENSNDPQLLSGTQPALAILGAGSIGCFLGAHFIKAGFAVSLIGRARLQKEIASSGITISSLARPTFHIAASEIEYTTDPAALKDASLILVCVKSLQTNEAAMLIKEHAPPDAIVISFQNGLHNASQLKTADSQRQVLAGMVPYNVLQKGHGQFHNGTSGKLLLQDEAGISAGLVPMFQAVGLDLALHADLQGILRGKLLFNLNNALNALAGVPLQEELKNRDYRHLLAAAMQEGRRVFKAARLSVRSLGRMIPWLAPPILRLPNWLFFRVASSMIQIDPEARSSMWEDLQRGRQTEIDFLNGELVNLADKFQVAVPVNRMLVDLIKQRESGQSKQEHFSPEELMSYVKK